MLINIRYRPSDFSYLFKNFATFGDSLKEKKVIDILFFYEVNRGIFYLVVMHKLYFCDFSII